MNNHTAALTTEPKLRVEHISREMYHMRIIALLLIFGVLSGPLPALALSSDGNNLEYITVSKNLGIGVQNPSSRLIVNGTSLMRGKLTLQDGSQSNGYILISDINGKGTWTNASILASSEVWADQGSYLRPLASSGVRDVVLGSTALGTANIALGANGTTIFNQQTNNADLRIAGDNISNLFFTDASVDRVGLSDASPVALLDVGNGTANYIDGTNDLIVKGDMEVDDTFYGQFNGGTFYGSGSRVLNYPGSPKGPEGAVQFNNGSVLGSKAGFEWRKDTYRLGLMKSSADTLTDYNGAMTIRPMQCPSSFILESGGGSSSIPRFVDYTFNGDPLSGGGPYLNAGVKIPAAVASNDLLIAMVTSHNGITITTPSGWTHLLTNSGPPMNPDDLSLSNMGQTAIYYKIASASEPSGYSFNFNTGSNVSYNLLVRYNGTSLSSPISASAVLAGVSGTFGIPAPALDSFTAEGHTILRLFNAAEPLGSIMAPFLSGYTVQASKEGISTRTSVYAMDKQNVSGAVGSLMGGLMADHRPYYYTDFTLALKGREPDTRGVSAATYAGCSNGTAHTQDFVPDPNSMTYWVGRFDGNGDNGDVTAEINNGSLIKQFKLIDFDKDYNNVQFNGMTLNGLTANRLVVTDSVKKLASTTNIMLAANGNVGISTASPSSKLVVDTSTVTKDLKISGGATNQYILVSNSTGNGAWTASNEVFQDSVAGNDREVQFNDGGVFAGDAGLTWASSKLNTNYFQADNGSNAVPRYSFAASNGTGIYNSSANSLAFSGGGVGSMKLSSSGNLGLNNPSPVAKLDINGSLALKSPSTVSLNSNSSLSSGYSYMRIQGNGSAVKLSSATQIASGQDGQILFIKGNHATNTVEFVNNNGTSLSDGANIKLGQKDLLFMYFDSDDNQWIELGRSDN